MVLQACNQVPIKDEIFYGNKGMQGAVEFHFLTADTQPLTMEEWMTLLRSQPLICESPTAFGDAKGAIEKLCSICNCCSYDTTKAMERFFQEVQDAGK